MGACRYCGDQLMSESTVCVTCFRQYYRDCSCYQKVQLYDESGKKDGYVLRACQFCKICMGKGWYMDEAPQSSLDAGIVKSAQRRYAPDTGTLANTTNAGADTTTVTHSGHATGNGV